MKLSIIIVNYNVTELLRNCLLSIQKFVKDIEYEVIVIDNFSPDTSWKNLIGEFSDFKFIAHPENAGFAVANNTAASHASGEYLLILNPDTEFEGFYIEELLDFAEAQENFGCLGIRMYDAAGNFLPESKRSVPDMFNSFEKLFTSFKKNSSKSYYRNDIPDNAVAEVDVVTGAFCLVKKSVYEEIGGFDEAYFMYGEDIDLCYSIQRLGYRNFYYGKASLLHYKGESTIKDKIYLQRFYGAMQIFVNKYYHKNPVQHLILSAGLRLKHFAEKMKL